MQLSTECLESITVAFLNSHNLYRAMHGTPYLIQNSTIEAMAQDYANYLAINGLFKHSGVRGYGENLAYQYSVGKVPNIDLPYNCGKYASTFVRLWYDEMNWYDFNSPGFTRGLNYFNYNFLFIFICSYYLM